MTPSARVGWIVFALSLTVMIAGLVLWTGISRFYRSRYDHKLLVEELGIRLRDEVKLDSVRRSFIGVAGQVVRRTSITLWLRGGLQPAAHDAR